MSRFPTGRIVAGLVVGSILVAGISWTLRPLEPLDDLWILLEEKGFQPNVGLDATLEPGTVIQTREWQGDQQVDLKRPIVVFRKADCFPLLTIEERPFPLPQRTATTKGQLGLTVPELQRLLPDLELRSNSAGRFSLMMSNPRVLSLDKGKLSGGFSEECHRKFEVILSPDGEKPEPADFFKIVLETIVADGFSVSSEWNSNVEQKAEVLESVAASAGRNSTETTRVEGTRVVLGHNFRSLEPKWEK